MYIIQVTNSQNKIRVNHKSPPNLTCMKEEKKFIRLCLKANDHNLMDICCNLRQLHESRTSVKRSNCFNYKSIIYSYKNPSKFL